MGLEPKLQYPRLQNSSSWPKIFVIPTEATEGSVAEGPAFLFGAHQHYFRLSMEDFPAMTIQTQSSSSAARSSPLPDRCAFTSSSVTRNRRMYSSGSSSATI